MIKLLSKECVCEIVLYTQTNKHYVDSVDLGILTDSFAELILYIDEFVSLT